MRIGSRGEWLMFESECGLRTVYTEPAVSIGLVRDEY